MALTRLCRGAWGSMNGGRARETVQKLWSASRSLQGGGVSYYEYLTELTYLLLLKMLEEVKRLGKPLEERLPQSTVGVS